VEGIWEESSHAEGEVIYGKETSLPRVEEYEQKAFPSRELCCNGGKNHS